MMGHTGAGAEVTAGWQPGCSAYLGEICSMEGVLQIADTHGSSQRAWEIANPDKLVSD